ncbi:MAG TPA: S9 family peptidase [Myxococcales bacterium]|jgi:dipeptidyl aminopeptidase/acylaminoacyl peptidase
MQFGLACIAVASALLGAAPAVPGLQAEPAPPSLVPRELFFGNPERANPQLSPDGTLLSWLQPDERGALQILVRPLATPQAAPRQVTSEKGRGIGRYQWAYNGDLLFLQDVDGDEQYRLFAVRLSDGRVMRLTALAGNRACDLQLSPDNPGKALVTRPQRRVTKGLFAPPSKALFEPWLVDLRTGDLRPQDSNPGDATSWLADAQLAVRARVRTREDGGARLEVRGASGAGEEWRTLLSWSVQETVEPLGISADGKDLFVLGNLGRDTVVLDQIDLATGKARRLAADAAADVFGVDLHPVSRRVRAVAFNRARMRWQALEPDLAKDLAALSKIDGGDLQLLGGDQADKTWVVLFDRDTSSGRFYLWDRAAQRATLLFSTRPELDKVELSPMKPVEIAARDGLSLPSYLTLPARLPPKSLPMVLLVHGGPWTRDLWGYDGLVQFLASRGWAVLQVNFRGSVGFGKKFKNAAVKQFARRMHDDLIDGVRWAVRQGYADPKRVAIMGDSYGGYATLVGLTFTPETFACGVDLFGPSNLVTLLENPPDYWKPFLSSTWYPFAGDPRDPKARADLESRSPIFKADAIRAPLLIGQGANDPRVPPEESEQMVAAIRKKGGKVEFVAYADEGHGFTKPANRMDFYSRAERFLEECLGKPPPDPLQRSWRGSSR